MRVLALAWLAGCTPETDVLALTPEIAVAPTSVALGDVGVPLTVTSEVWVTNAGRARLEVDLGFSSDRDVFSVDPSTLVVAAGDQVPVTVTFRPATFLDYATTLALTSNDPDTPLVEVAVTGTGVQAPLPDIDVDPPAIDFGAVSSGTTALKYLVVSNEGGAPLHLGLLSQTGSGAFRLETDPSNTPLAAGAQVPVLITYAPGQGGGDSGVLTLPSDDPDEPTVQVVLLGNGGGAFEYPMAVIDCPSGAEPPEWIDLDGSGSSDPSGQLPLDYTWSLFRRPPGSQAGLTNLVSPTTAFFADIAGTYEVQLTVENQVGLSSAPARCEIEAVPADDVHVELTWDTSRADLDLHLLQEDGTLFERPGDCNYCNPTPSWGASGTTDDPRLDLDDRSGFGPENINIESPAAGRYLVKVHYFEEKGDDAVTATVRVYTFGALVAEETRILHRNEVWDVGQVNWPQGTFGVQSTALWAATVRSCY